MKLCPTSLALLSVALAQLHAQRPDDLTPMYDAAEKSIVRLPPSAFAGLPAGVARELHRRGCTIPQTPFTPASHNVIKGEFAKSGQIDWAVLCSIKGTSTILVFWNGEGDNPAAINAQGDRRSLQGFNTGMIGYGREIGAVGKDFIMRNYYAYAGPKPPPIDHQGIDDALLQNASVTWYYHAGKWVKLAGADYALGVSGRPVITRLDPAVDHIRG
jgi:hypothetical protein